MNWKHTFVGSLLLTGICLLPACKQSDTAPKGPPKSSAPQAAKPPLPPGHPPIGSATNMASQALPPGVMSAAKTPQWTVPKDWQAGKPSTVRRGSWIVNGPDGQAADVAVTAFPGDVGGEIANINRWRAQIGLSPIKDTEVDSVTTKIVFGTMTATLVDFTNPALATGEKFPQRMLVATLTEGGNSWFFKMTGAAPLVEAQKQAFIDFVKSVKF